LKDQYHEKYPVLILTSTIQISGSSPDSSTGTFEMRSIQS
jgi:hypothetical protein